MARKTVKAKVKQGRKSSKTDKATRTKKKSEKLKLDVNVAPVKKTPGSAFYAGVLDAAEKSTRMQSNSMRYLKPLSTDSLQINRALSGGLYNAFGSVAGPEGSGKTTLIYHCMSSALHHNVNFTSFIDAEGTLNEQFAGNVFSSYGMDFRALVDDKHSPFRYYRRNVIETVFDLLHFVLKRMPDKVWVPETESWGYVIPKNNKHFSALAEGLGLKADKSLSTSQDFVCPTDNDRIEGAAFLDSLAAMVTESDDESEERSKRRAAEAAAYSEHLKRVVSRLASKGMVFYGTNQVRKIPGQTYGDPLYEPGGEAIKFYCLPDEEYITTDAGLMTIGEFRQVLSQHGLPVVASLKGAEQTTHFAETGFQSTVLVKTDAGRMVKTGKKHRVLAIHRDSLKPRWVRCSRLTSQHFIATRLGNEVYGRETDLNFEPTYLTGRFGNHTDPYFDWVAPAKLTAELAELLGVLVADGFINSKSPYCVQITKHDPNQRQSISRLFHKAVGLRMNDSGKELRLNSQTVSQFFAYLGIADVLTEDKQIPLCIRTAPKELQLSFLRGYLSCDATLASGTDIVAYSSSKHIVRQMSLMLANMGIYTLVEDQRYDHGKTVTRQGIIAGSTSRLVLPHLDAQMLLDLMGGMADYAPLQSIVPRTLMRKARYNPAGRLPELWGWKKRAINRVIGHSSQYAASFNLSSGEGKGGYFYWSELTDACFEAATPSKYATPESSRRFYAELREFRRLRDFTKENNLVWERVVNVRIDSKPTATFDFEVPGSHSVVAGGIVGHNSSHRLRINAVSSPEGGEVQRDKRVTSQAIEPSVHREGQVDRYKYKKVKNTKNKMGFPGHTCMMRVWVADVFGRVRGFDPFYDVLSYLEDTDQIRKVGLKKGKMQYAFQLRESFGTKRVKMYNSIAPFSYLTLKRLVLSEVEGSKKLLMEAADEMSINPRFLLAGKLRAALFLQQERDKSLLQLTELEKKKKKSGKEDSMEDDDDDAEEL